MSIRTGSLCCAVAMAAVLALGPAGSAIAQQASANANGQDAYADYYSKVRALKEQHMQALADIDARYAEAIAQYREENAKRAQALPDLYTAAHKGVRDKGLKGAEQQAEYERIKAEDRKRRDEYAEWRDSTARRLQDEHAAARNAEITRHQAEYDRLLADRNAKLAGLRALDGSVGLTPGAAAALGEAAPAGAEPTPESGSAEPGSDGSDVEASLDGLESLGRASDGQAGIGTADEASGSGSGDDAPDVSSGLGGLEMLTRADAEDASAGATSSTGIPLPATRTPPAGLLPGTNPAAGTVPLDRPADGIKATNSTAGATAVLDDARLDGRGGPAPAPAADRSAKDFRVPAPAAAGAGMAGTDVRATGNVGAGVAGSGATGSGVAAADTVGVGTTGSTSDRAGLGSNAGERNTDASAATGIGQRGSKLAAKLPESSSAGAGDTDVGGVAAGAGSGSGVDMPSRDDGGDYFEYGDGSRVRAVGPDGQVGQVNEKGDIVYGDGTTIVHTGDREITIHRPDGSSSTRQLDADGNWRPSGSTSAEDYPRGSSVDVPVRSDDGSTFVYDDGSTVRAIGPEGDLGKVNDKGDIVFADGTSIVHTGEREITVHRPDGSSDTQRFDANGQWQPVSATKPETEGKGSNDKYVVSTAGGASSGGASGSSSGSGSGSGKTSTGPGDSSSSSSSGKPSSSSSSDDNDNEGSGSSSGNDSDESGSADGGSSEGDSSESSDDADTDGEGAEYYGENGSGSGRGGPSDVVQGIVDRVTGQSRDVETTAPQPCGESGGFGVTQPGPGGAGNCIPGNLPTVSEDNDQQPDTPDAGASVNAEDARRTAGSGISGRITQPGLGAEGVPVEDLPSQSALDRSPVVNPPQP